MPSCESANLIQTKLIQHYHSRQKMRRDFISLEDAAREWIDKRAAKFRAYWLRRQIYDVREFVMIPPDRSTMHALSRCA